MPSCNAYHLTWDSLTVDVGYLFAAAPAKHSCCSLPWKRDISSLPPLLNLNVKKLLSALLRAMLSKYLIQFSTDGWICVPSLFFWPQAKPGRDLPQKDLGMLSAWPLSRALSTHASAGDSWTLTGKCGSVPCGDTAPFSWILVCMRFYLCLPKICFLSPMEVL